MIKIKTKNGSMFDLIAWVIIAIVVVLFLGFWVYGFHLMTTELEKIPTTSNGFNFSNATMNTFGQIDSAQQTWLPIIAFAIILCEALTLWITNYYVKEHPLMFIPYLFVIAVAVVVAAIISNVYQGLLTGGFAFSATLLTFTMADYIMIYLPLWTSIIGAGGVIFLLANIMYDKPESA